MLDSEAGYKALRHSVGVYVRPARALRLEGRDHVPALMWTLAKNVEYAEPGQIVESLALDSRGNAIGTCLVFLGDEHTTILDETESGIESSLQSAKDSLALEDFTIADQSANLGCIAVEGPYAWKVIDGVLGEEHVSELLLNEWRDGSVGDIQVSLGRVGVTAEYGYVLVAPAGAIGALLSEMGGRATALEGGIVSAESVLRAKIEVNHYCGAVQSEGLNLFEAGIAWLTTLEREDDFLGKSALIREAPSRRLIAARSSRDVFPPAGATVSLGGKSIGRVQLVAPTCGAANGVGLLLLDAPFDVPGVELVVDGIELITISRPTVDPVSWVVGLGESL